MNRDAIRTLLEEVASGQKAVDSALHVLRDFPSSTTDFAQLDTHRCLRQGLPETIFGEGKQPTQVATLLERLRDVGQDGLVTRVSSEMALEVQAQVEDVQWFPVPRLLFLPGPPTSPPEVRGTIAVVCAGTSDLPVAEEAAKVAELFGNPVERHWDVGVAGIHRILERQGALSQASVLIVIAGMEGALASVVAGLVGRPIIAVPTSVGYGASFGGLAALLGMLNSCAPGVSVVNIDNGYGAAVQATLINRVQEEIESHHPEGV
ncbi:MAG: nickel pincer cofactor biosynthesis protein LarB [Myxococcota bacterium]|nr:nickel pincer cofactor biosynthesis protein LarB [Myxococcota bacterium]